MRRERGGDVGEARSQAERTAGGGVPEPDRDLLTGMIGACGN